MNETFDELERKAYISNLTDLAKLDDVHNLEIQVGVWKGRYNTIKDKVEKI